MELVKLSNSPDMDVRDNENRLKGSRKAGGARRHIAPLGNARLLRKEKPIQASADFR